MKISLKNIALLFAATYPVAVIAEIFGANLPAVFKIENGATLFSLILIGLTLAADYSRAPRPRLTASNTRECDGRGETHRLAAWIGTEPVTASLATSIDTSTFRQAPTNRSVFPKALICVQAFSSVIDSNGLSPAR
jgi:hypothetical protein